MHSIGPSSWLPKIVFQLLIIPGTIIGIQADFLDTACFVQPIKLGRCDRRLVSQIRFSLYTKNNSAQGYPLRTNDLRNLEKSPFVQGDNVGLKVLIHGLYENSVEEFAKRTKNAYLSLAHDTNVIVVDWNEAAIGSLPPRRTYSEAASCTQNVAEASANLVKFLVEQKYISLDQIHVIGDGVGAHAAGILGRYLGGKVARITGLDPSRPCFRVQDPGGPSRIGKGDAIFVDIIHTDGSTGSASNFGKGLLEALGDADFYANDGTRNQPGCGGRFTYIPNPGDSCSHERASLLFIESILNPSAFQAQACPSLSAFRTKSCNNGEVRLVGESTPTDTENGATFYFRTRDRSPFSLSQDEVP